jgi:hypothetical protein
MTPDSSEIAKHVRAVHLTLVLACVLVFTILFGASPSSVETAYKQLLNVIAIKDSWKDWTRRFGHEQLTWLRDNGIIPVKILPSEVFITSEELARRNLPPQPSDWSVSLKFVLYFYVNPQGPPANVGREEMLAWPQNTEQGLKVIAGGSDSGGSPRLKSLQEFRYFWNGAGHIYVFYVTELSPVVYLVSNGEVSNRLSWTPTSRASQHSGLELRRTGLPMKEQEKCDALSDTLLSPWKPKFDFLFCGMSPIENTQAVLPARVTTRDVPISLRQWLAKQFGLDSAGNPFEKTFRELYQITRPYQELSLDNAKPILEGELKRAGERVQFLGLTFPERLVSTWGIAIILIIQLYFWIHLRELRFRVVPDDPAVKEAWIGFYTGYIARLGSVLTASILPLGAVLYLAWNQGFSRALVGLSVVEFVLAMHIFFLLHQVVRRVTQPNLRS